jgi:signal transduction histidine kinase
MPPTLSALLAARATDSSDASDDERAHPLDALMLPLDSVHDAIAPPSAPAAAPKAHALDVERLSVLQSARGISNAGHSLVTSRWFLKIRDSALAERFDAWCIEKHAPFLARMLATFAIFVLAIAVFQFEARGDALAGGIIVSLVVSSSTAALINVRRPSRLAVLAAYLAIVHTSVGSWVFIINYSAAQF